MAADPHIFIKLIGAKLGQKWTRGFKDLGNNAIGLTRNDYITEVLPNIDKYMITDKADGERVFLIFGDSAHYLVSSGAYPLEFAESKSQQKLRAIFDGELIELGKAKQSKAFFIFDVIEYDGRKVADEPFAKRHNYLKDFEKKYLGTNTHIAIKKFTPMTIATYQNNIMTQYNTNKKARYRTDGIIFTRTTQTYRDTQNFKWKPPEHLTIDFLAIKADTLSFGPSAALSTSPPNRPDFARYERHRGHTFGAGKSNKKGESKRATTKSKTRYVLMVGITDRMFKQCGLMFPNEYVQLVESIDAEIVIGSMIKSKYFPVPFMPSITIADSEVDQTTNIYDFDGPDDLHGHIIELSWVDGWVFHRTRTDRDVELSTGTYYGNNYKVAELTLQSAINPLTLKDLIAPHSTLSQSIYFQKTDDMYLYLRKFNNYVKQTMIHRHKGTNFVIDIASGRGADLNKYVEANIRNLLMLEIDADAIDELLQRKYNILTKKHVSDDPIIVDHYAPHGCSTAIVQMDMNQNYAKNISRVDQVLAHWPNIGAQSAKSSTIFCNLALHYMLSDVKQVRNTAEFINHYLAPGGTFIFSIMSGDAVFKFLQKHNGKWVTYGGQPRGGLPNGGPPDGSQSSGTTPKFHLEFMGKMPAHLDKSGYKIKVLLPCTDEPREEPLVYIHDLDRAFKGHSITRIQEVGFDSMLNEFRKYRRDLYDKLTPDEKEFIALYQFVIYNRI